MVHKVPWPERLPLSCNDIHFIQDRKLLSLANITRPLTRCTPCLREQPPLHPCTVLQAATIAQHCCARLHSHPSLLTSQLLLPYGRSNAPSLKPPLPAPPRPWHNWDSLLWPLKASGLGLFAAFSVLHCESSPHLAASSLRTDTSLLTSVPRTWIRAWSRYQQM